MPVEQILSGELQHPCNNCKHFEEIKNPDEFFGMGLSGNGHDLTFTWGNCKIWSQVPDYGGDAKRYKVCTKDDIHCEARERRVPLA